MAIPHEFEKTQTISANSIEADGAMGSLEPIIYCTA